MSAYRYLPSTPGEISDLLSAMFLYLPEYQLPNSNLDMAGEFSLIRESLGIIKSKIGEEKFAALMQMSYESEAFYNADDIKTGGSKLREMKSLLRKKK
ncbi:MAG: hypothetical protein ABL912_14245 [Novosphingobium sp.]